MKKELEVKSETVIFRQEKQKKKKKKRERECVRGRERNLREVSKFI